jgi:hypothetical protein
VYGFHYPAESENESSAIGLQPRKRPQPSPAVLPSNSGNGELARVCKRANSGQVASLDHIASATAASGHKLRLFVRCKTSVAENVWKKLLEQGENAFLYSKIVEHDIDQEKIVLMTFTSSANLQAVQSSLVEEGIHLSQFHATSQNQVRISRNRIP